MMESGVIFSPHPCRLKSYGQYIPNLYENFTFLTENGISLRMPDSFYVQTYLNNPRFTIQLSNAYAYKTSNCSAKITKNKKQPYEFPIHKNRGPVVNIISPNNTASYIPHPQNFILFLTTNNEQVTYSDSYSHTFDIPRQSTQENLNAVQKHSFQYFVDGFDPVIKPPQEHQDMRSQTFTRGVSMWDGWHKEDHKNETDDSSKTVKFESERKSDVTNKNPSRPTTYASVLKKKGKHHKKGR